MSGFRFEPEDFNELAYYVQRLYKIDGRGVREKACELANRALEPMLKPSKLEFSPRDFKYLSGDDDAGFFRVFKTPDELRRIVAWCANVRLREILACAPQVFGFVTEQHKGVFTWWSETREQLGRPDNRRARLVEIEALPTDREIDEAAKLQEWIDR